MQASADLRKAFQHQGITRSLAKKTSLLEQGDVSHHVYYIESGCFRLWHNDDNQDISVKFFLPGELCASLDSFYNEQPSIYGIESIVPSVVRIFTRQDIRNLMEQSQSLREYSNAVMIHCMKDYQDLFLERISKSPEERYRALIAQAPETLDIVPLHYIASYLGITPVSLSRIRRKLENT